LTYIPNTDSDRKQMMAQIGITDIEELLSDIPGSLKLQRDLNMPAGLSEMELKKLGIETSERNTSCHKYASFLGGGAYDHYIPATVGAVISRSEFYTSYTPYQPEISQGNLQSIFEFQTLVCQLTGMDVANASMYDGATALAEAAMMAAHITGRGNWVVSGCVNPMYLEVMKTYAWASGNHVLLSNRLSLRTDVEDLLSSIDRQTACVVVQNPNFFGSLEQIAEIESAAHEAGALFIMSVNPISLGILKTPGEWNADICVAEGQPLGISMGYGGPLLGLFACKSEYVRHMPGRLVGATKDKENRTGYVLTLQTREQHIRREKATSNICTNEALYALAASVYLCTLGREGLRRVADMCFQKAHYAAKNLAKQTNVEVLSKDPFFHEFVVNCNRSVDEVNAELSEHRMVGGLPLGQFYPEMMGCMLVCLTEKRTKSEIDAFVRVLAK